jgi:hypothetical protein
MTSHTLEGGAMASSSTTTDSTRPASARPAPKVSSERRAGAYARRQLRRKQKDWLRRNLPALAAFAAVVGFGVLIAQLLMPNRLADIASGALVASAAWWLYTFMMETAGMGQLRSGILAEERTSVRLSSLRNAGWRYVNHVRFKYGDADHAVLGPGGFFAVETKFRSNWVDSDLDAIAAQARESARQLRPWIGPKEKAAPLVAMWGPLPDGPLCQVFEHGGVTFVPGEDIADYLRSLAPTKTDDQIDNAAATLEANVRIRDRGEVSEDGPFVRPVLDDLSEMAITGMAAVLAFYAVVPPASWRPEGWWSLGAAIVVTIGAYAVRRRWPRPHIRHITTAVMASALGLWAIFGLYLLVSAAT